MALWADLMVNDERIGRVEAVRINGGTDPDDWNTYKWTRSMVNPEHCGEIRTGTIGHRYGDGAAWLLAKVLMASEPR